MCPRRPPGTWSHYFTDASKRSPNQSERKSLKKDHFLDYLVIFTSGMVGSGAGRDPPERGDPGGMGVALGEPGLTEGPWGWTPV